MFIQNLYKYSENHHTHQKCQIIKNNLTSDQYHYF